MLFLLQLLEAPVKKLNTEKQIAMTYFTLHALECLKLHFSRILHWQKYLVTYSGVHLSVATIRIHPEKFEQYRISGKLSWVILFFKQNANKKTKKTWASYFKKEILFQHSLYIVFLDLIFVLKVSPNVEHCQLLLAGLR